MTLTPKTKLGPYEILVPIGAGGMGEVYHARDLRLERDVAVKVLPDALAHDKERILRFEREAKSLATLSHPNIAAIYGFEEHGGKRLLIMELAEGETLAERLSRSPLSQDEALEINRRIAEGLEAAHEKNIVHRDLKPANIKVSPEGTVKILDFGLAKALLGEVSSSPSMSPSQAVNSPTITAEYTRPGIILGTAGYMSPEQARGRSVDKRTDIWAFGCVLFECLSGARLFSGETATDSIGAILHKEPEWALLPPETPPTIHLLLRRCLAKDRNKRLRDIGDARIELENALVDPTSSFMNFSNAAMIGGAGRGAKPTWRRNLPWVLCVLLATGLGALVLGNRPAKAPVMHLSLLIPDGQQLTSFPGSRFDISPDATHIVYVGTHESGRRLYLRKLAQLDAVPLANTDDSFFPFFSPDGEWIAFGQKGKLRKISILGGPATTICDAAELRGGSWGPDGTILFAPSPRSGIHRVSAAGGEPAKLTDAGRGAESPSHRWPSWLPDGKSALFVATDRNSDYSDARIMVLDVESGAQRVILSGGTSPHYLSTGHLVFGRAGTLMAVRFDLKKLESSGAAIPILEGVLSAPTFGGLDYALSDTGALMYVGGAAGGEEKIPVLVDREGKETALSQRKGDYSDARISHDGTRLAASIMDAGNVDIWVSEIGRDSFTRLTVDISLDMNPRWSPDGKWIIYSTNRETNNINLFRQLADGTGKAERLTSSENSQFPSEVTEDGSLLVYVESFPTTDSDIMCIPFGIPDAVPEVVISTPFIERGGSVSPDGKWIVYVSHEGGEPEVYIRPFRRPGARTKISAGRGWIPRWSTDGKEVFYRSDRKLMAVPVMEQDETVRTGTPQLLFESKNNSYTGPLDVTADGRFLYLRPAGELDEQAEQPTVVVNWIEEFKSKLSALK